MNGRDQAPCDWRYPRLLEWAGHAKLLPDKVLHVLQTMVQADPAAASAALRRTRELREALFVVITAMILGKGPPKGAVDVLSRYWQAGVAAHELRYEGRRLRLDMHAGAVDLDLIASLIAYRFVGSVLPEPLDRQVTPLPGPHAAGEERETGP